MKLSFTSQEILRQAEDFGGQFLPHEPSDSSPTVVHHHHYHGGGWYYWGCPEPVYVSCWPKSMEQKKKDKVDGIILLASVIAMGAAYAFGREVGNLSEINRKFGLLEELKEELIIRSSREEHAAVEPVLGIQEKMLGEMSTYVKVGALAKAILCGSALAVGAGAYLPYYAGMAAAADLVPVGVVGGVASAGFLLARWGFSDMDNWLRGQAYQLLNVVNDLRSQQS